MIPRLVFIAGVDGAGKTCHSEWLVEHFRHSGLKSDIAWSRFNNYLSKPLLALTRLTGHNYYKTIDGIRFGYHNFESLYGFRELFALLQAIDVNIAAARDIRKPMQSSDVLVCERGPWDTLVDVIADTGINSLQESWVGRLYTSQVRSNAQVILVQRSLDKILQTRPELENDKKLEKRINIYAQLAEKNGWTIVNNNGTIDETRRQLSSKFNL